MRARHGPAGNPSTVTRCPTAVTSRKVTKKPRDRLTLRQKLDNQVKGAQRCIIVWAEKNFCDLDSSQKIVILQNLRRLFKKCSLVDFPKRFKYMLAWNFSRFLSQELPEGPSEFSVPIYSLFHKKLRNVIKRTIRSNRITRKARILWDLMQSKSLANRVPEDFIQAAYEKHRLAMSSRPECIPQEYIDELKLFAREWANKSARGLSSESIPKPTNHSTNKSSRSDGGSFTDLIPNIRPKGWYQEDRSERIDPVVIHLEGPPGAGKSTLVGKLTGMIAEKFGYSKNILPSSYVYHRSAATAHWDGYRGQLITVIDDFGFRIHSTQKEAVEMEEILQLCSTCDVVLPMADLKEKGRKFTSKFLILTSNKGTSSTTGLHFSCPTAFYRRISPTYVLLNKFGIRRYDLNWCNHQELVGHEVLSNFDVRNNCGCHTDSNGRWLFQSHSNVNQIVETAMATYRSRAHVGIIYPLKGNDHIGYEFEVNPPNEIPFVLTHAIPEPLKVRTITKPDARSYVLKPLQQSMFKALGSWPEFLPCSNPYYDLTQLDKSDKEYLLSGDYTAATDELNFFASQSIIDVLAEELELQGYPEIASWVQWEGGVHEVRYPPHTLIPPTYQINGQLMGSLLSFPILCIINAFTMHKATGKPLGEIPALFHGDDIVAKVSMKEFRRWKYFAALMGLQLSVGKNYLSKEFCSIDSRLYTRSNTGKLSQNDTGKYRLIHREGGVLCCKDAIHCGFSKNLIRRYCTEELKDSIRNLDVSYEYGGLGVEGEPATEVDRMIYLVELHRKIKPRPLGHGLFDVPEQVARILRLPEFCQMATLEERLFNEVNLKVEVARRKNWCSKQHIVDYVPLSLIRRKTVRCVGLSPQDLYNFCCGLFHLTSVSHLSRRKSGFVDESRPVFGKTFGSRSRPSLIGSATMQLISE